MEMNKKETIIEENLSAVSGGYTEEEYYAQAEKFGHIDTEAHLLEGTKCPDCGWVSLHSGSISQALSEIKKGCTTAILVMNTRLQYFVNNAC